MVVLIVDTISIVFGIIDFLIFIRIILSWIIPMDGRNKFMTIIYQLTEPLLRPIRELLKKSPLTAGMNLDFSPVILVIILSLIERLLYLIII